jgi:hypothetical protein
MNENDKTLKHETFSAKLAIILHYIVLKKANT